MNPARLSKLPVALTVLAVAIALAFLFRKEILSTSLQPSGTSAGLERENPNNPGLAPDSPRSSAADKKTADPITPSSAAAALEKIRQLSDIKKRSEQSYAVIHDLCKAGHFEEAWSLIDESSGKVREWELAAFFEHAKLDTAQLVEKLNTLLYKNEVRDALGTKLYSLSIPDMKKLLKDGTFAAYIGAKQQEDPRFLQKLLQQDLLTRSSSSLDEAKIQSIQQAIDWHAEGLVDDKSLMGIVARDPNPDPWQRWDLLAKYIPSTNRESFPGSVRSNAIEKMIETDAKKAVELLATGEGEQGAWDLSRGIRKWAAVDSPASANWYEANKGRLTDTQRDAAAEAFYDLARGYGEVEGATQWANQISNPEKKKALLESLNPPQKTAP